jgi:hypothetical protein
LAEWRTPDVESFGDGVQGAAQVRALTVMGGHESGQPDSAPGQWIPPSGVEPAVAKDPGGKNI